MRWSDVLVVPPRAEPMHLEEARQHLRLTEDDPRDEDSLIEAWIAAARESAEDETGRQLVLATRELHLSKLPESGVIVLPHPPLREVVSITFTSENGDDTAVPLDDVIIDTASEPGRIVLKGGKSWSTKGRGGAFSIAIRYKAGYAAPFDASTETSNVMAIDHPYKDGDRVRLWNSGGALPAPLRERTDYFVVNHDGDTFQLATASGGSPVTIADEGTGTHFVGLMPEGVRAAMKLMVGSRYEHREDIVVGVSAQEMPQAAKALLWPRRVWYPGPAGVA